MATSFLSPGVYTREIDFSLYLPNLSTTALGCVGYATKGPINQPQYISNPVQFSTVFGDPSPNMPATYSALQFLSIGRQLWYVRVAENEEVDAELAKGYVYKSRPSSLTLQEVTTKAKVTGTKTNVVTVVASGSPNNVLTFNIDGTANALSVTFDLDGASSIYMSITDIVNALNKNNNFAAYFLASLSPIGALVVERLLAGDNHGFTVAGSGIADIFGLSAAKTVWGTGNSEEAAYIMPNVAWPVSTDNPNTISIDASSTLIFIVDGTAVTVTTPAVLTDYTLEGFVAFLNAKSTFVNAGLVASALAGGLFVSLTPSATAVRLMLGGDSTGADIGPTVFGKINAATYMEGNSAATLTYTSANNNLAFSFIAAAGTYTEYMINIPAATYTAGTLATAINTELHSATNTTVSPYTHDDLTSVLVASAVGNYIKLTYSTGTTKYVVFDSTSTAFLPVFGANPIQKAESTIAADVLTVTAASDGTWGNKLALNIASVDVTAGTFNINVYERGYLVERYENLVKTPEALIDGTANPKFVETAVNGVSSRITVSNAVGTGQGLLPTENSLGSLTSLSGGNDGTASVTNPSTFIGVSDDTAPTGLQLFRNPEQLDINLIIVPGIASAPVINAMVDVCLFRRDCMCIVDPPYGKKPQDVVDWVNGAGTYATEHAAFNTSFASLYWPWLQIYDPVNKQTVWTPPSGHIAFVYAFTDYNSETWFAPAGLNRGHLTTPLRAEYIPTLGERDLLYQNNINPIATFIRDGINVWGQKTLQRTPTALDRVNVRRLMLYLEKVVATAVRTLTFEPTDKITWIQFINLVEPFLESVKSRRGVLEYKVVCDETTNTPDVQDRNEMHARIYIRPTKTAEFISIDFVLTDSGTAFTELVF